MNEPDGIYDCRERSYGENNSFELLAPFWIKLVVKYHRKGSIISKRRWRVLMWLVSRNIWLKLPRSYRFALGGYQELGNQMNQISLMPRYCDRVAKGKKRWGGRRCYFFIFVLTLLTITLARALSSTTATFVIDEANCLSHAHPQLWLSISRSFKFLAEHTSKESDRISLQKYAKKSLGGGMRGRQLQVF